MCGFFEELGKAAKQLDKFAKEMDEDKKSSKEIPKKQTAPPEGLDMRQFLTIAEVARVTGLPFNKYYNSHLDDTWEGGVYSCSDPKIHTHFQAFFARKDVDGYDPDGVLSYPLEVMPNLQPVKGIGDEAYWSDISGTIYVLKDQDVLQASTSGDSGLSLGIMKQLVKIIISKV